MTQNEATPELLAARARLNNELEEKWKSILSSVSSATNSRELLTEEVRSFYRAEFDLEKRPLLYEDLRKIAASGHFVKTFDSAFQNFKKSVEAKERADKAWTDKPDNYVSIDTVTQALSDLEISVKFNQLTKDIEISGLPGCYSKDNAVNVLPVFLRDYMRSEGYQGSTELNIKGCLNCIADRNRYNPFKEYLLNGVWDGTDRFPEIYRILGVPSPRHQSYIRKWFIQCVALGVREDDDTENPFGAEGVLVLQGPQGLAKTSFFRIMSPFPRWFVEGAIIDMRDKDTQIKALQALIAELGELDGTIKKEQTSLKAFVTNPEDRIRTPYAASATRLVRRTSFCGTVNPKDFLRDDTGSRRWWVVPITHVDKKALFSLKRSWVNQLWFQIYSIYLDNPNGFRLSDDEMKELQDRNEEFERPLRYEIELSELLNFCIPQYQWEWWKVGELKNRINDRADPGAVGKALKRVMMRAGFDDPSSQNLARGSIGRVEYKLPLFHSEEYSREYGDSCEDDELPL